MHDPWEGMSPMEVVEEEIYAVSSGGTTEQIAETVAKKPLFANFFDALGFDAAQRHLASMFLTRIVAREDVGAYLDKKYPLPTNIITFTEEDKAVNSDHTRPLYLTSKVRKDTFKWAFVDTGASLNLIPLHIFNSIGSKESKIKKFQTRI
ncbi:hypothetical protein MKX03_026729 [Papaver bracteatum]|nr:hypothetical protein MKX03_026729 [Papaver bracteatum]